MAETGIKTLAGIYLALLALLALTVASAYLELGAGNTVANLGVAAAKAVLIAVFFMHLRAASAVLRLAAGAALLWLGLLIGLALSDYLTRPVDRVTPAEPPSLGSPPLPLS